MSSTREKPEASKQSPGDDSQLRIIRPNAGPQEMFLSTPADIAIYGGSAGGGKTWGLLMEPLRHIQNPRFGAVCFRRVIPQILNEGGLWDESQKLYPLVGGSPKVTELQWSFPSRAKVTFHSLQHDKDVHGWQGSQVPLFLFDELTHFTAAQFFYMLSRNRSLCGVRPYIRGTTNPDALSWVKEFLAPWVDSRHEDPAESGEIRWFVRDAGQILWVPQGTPDAKSVTFIRSSIYDNPVLLKANPEYLASLKALPLVERRRLLDGDWDIVEDGNFFRRQWFEIVEAAPARAEGGLKLCRYWDLAGTEAAPGKNPDWTVGALVGRTGEGLHFVLDVRRTRDTPGRVEQLVLQTAQLDKDRWGHVAIRMEQEPGSAGVAVTERYARVLNGFDYRGIRSTGPKAERAAPASAQAEAGNVKLLAGPWNNDFLNELSAFPGTGRHDDQVDAFSGAMALLAEEKRKIRVAGTRHLTA